MGRKANPDFARYSDRYLVCSYVIDFIGIWAVDSESIDFCSIQSTHPTASAPAIGTTQSYTDHIVFACGIPNLHPPQFTIGIYQHQIKRQMLRDGYTCLDARL